MAVSIYTNFLGGLPDREPLKSEIVAEPVEAWRIWQVVHSNALTLDRETLARMAAAHEKGDNPFVGLLSPALHSVGVQNRWQKSEVARCTQGGTHEAPDQLCGCGVWGLKEEHDLAIALNTYGNCAYGRVQMWGRIIEHEKGYRAQYARPLKVTLVGADATAENAADLSLAYGCEVECGEYPESLKGQLQSFGPGAVNNVMLSGAPHFSASIPSAAVMAWQQQQIQASTPSKVILWGFQAAVRGREKDYPVLAQAVKNMKPALNVKIEWLVPNHGRLQAWKNYTQIIRTKFLGNPLDALEGHLQDVERTLMHGCPAYHQGSAPLGLCGGVQHYLGRELRPGDHIALRPLRDLILLKDGRNEWLSEFSLQISPGPAIQKRRGWRWH